MDKKNSIFKEKKNFALSITMLFFADLIYFIWAPYPQNIIDSQSSNTIVNVVWFLMFSFIILWSVSSLSKSSKKITLKSILFSIAVCFSVQLLVDVIKIIANSVLKDYLIPADDILTVLSMTAIVVIISRYFKIKFFKKEKSAIICSTVAVVLVLILILIDVNNFISVKNAAPITGQTYKEFNTPFIHEIINALIAFLSVAGLLSVLYVSNHSTQKESSTKESIKDIKAQFHARLTILILFSIIVCGVKAAILPQNTPMFNLSLVSSSKEYKENEFSVDSSTTTVSRIIDNPENEKPVYINTKVKVFWGDKKIISFHLDGSYLSLSISKNGNIIVMEDTYDKIKVNGSEVLVLYDTAIAYLENEKPKAVMTHSLKNAKYDELLFEICKEIAEDDKQACFGLAYEYVEKYS